MQVNDWMAIPKESDWVALTSVHHCQFESWKLHPVRIPLVHAMCLPAETKEKKRKEKTMPFGVSLMRSQVLYLVACCMLLAKMLQPKGQCLQGLIWWCADLQHDAVSAGCLHVGEP